MLAGNAKRIFCDNVTCFGTNESCWNRSHLPEFFIKAPHFLLHDYSASLHKLHVLHFSGRRSLKHPRLSWPEQFILWLGKWGLKNVICFFGMASSRVLFLFRHDVETSNLGMYQHKNSVKPWKQLTWCQYGQKCKKLEKRWRRQGHFVWCVVFLQCSEIESDCYEIFQSQFGNPRISPVEFLLGIIFWSKK